MHEVVIIIAKYFIVLPPIILAVVWFRLAKEDRIKALFVGLFAAFVTGVLALIGSKLFHDPRPFVVGHFTPYFAHGKDNGFPSDHTLFTGLCAGLILVYNKRLGLVALAIAALIGLSRVIAGVHHLIDIVGALAFAAVGVWLAQLVVKRLSKPE